MNGHSSSDCHLPVKRYRSIEIYAQKEDKVIKTGFPEDTHKDAAVFVEV